MCASEYRLAPRWTLTTARFCVAYETVFRCMLSYCRSSTAEVHVLICAATSSVFSTVKSAACRATACRCSTHGRYELTPAKSTTRSGRLPYPDHRFVVATLEIVNDLRERSCSQNLYSTVA